MLALALVYGALWPARAPAQPMTGVAMVDSASVARSAWVRARRALRANDSAVARREVDHAASAWPVQPAYVWASAELAASVGDTAALRSTLWSYAQMGLGRDLRADSAIARRLSREQFASLQQRHDANRAPRVGSIVFATLPDSTFWPEGFDVDRRTGRIYLTSVRHRAIAEVSPDGSVREILPRALVGIGSMLAVRVDAARAVLWATTSGIPQMEGFQPADSSIAALLCIRISDGTILRRVNLPPGQHVLGDVALAANGDVLFSDSRDPALYWLRVGADTVIRIVSPLMRSPQGIAPRDDGRIVYLADYSHGLLRVDLMTRVVSWLGPAAGATPVGCDGIVFRDGTIIAIQNGVSPARVVRFDLDPTGERIVGAAVLDQNPVADEPTIGAIVDDEFIYVANSQWDKRDDHGEPIAGIRLTRPVLLAIRFSQRVRL